MTKEYKYKNTEVAGDPCWILEEWIDFIQGLISKYGEDVVMFIDAGYNNGSLVIAEEIEVELPKKKIKKKCPKCGK